MGTIIEKLQYTNAAVDDIQSAINEKGVECPDSTPLKDYGDKIRDIVTYQKPTFCPWFDFNQVYYGFDKSDIKFINDFQLSSKILFDDAVNLGTKYTGFDESDIQFVEPFEITEVTLTEKTYG